MKPTLTLLLTLLLTATATTSASAVETLDFGEAGRIVIQSGGRKKPLGTFSSETLLAISGRSRVADPQSGARMAPLDAMFSIWFGARDWENAPIILVAHAGLRAELDLPAEKMFSLNALLKNPRLREFHEIVQGKSLRNETLEPLEREASTVLVRMEMLNLIITGEGMAVVPEPTEASGRWLVLSALHGAYDSEKYKAIENNFGRMKEAYTLRDAAGFKTASAELRQALAQLAPQFYPSSRTLGIELHYNEMRPFRWAWILYAAAFFLALSKRSYPFALMALGAGIAFHTYGFGLRTIIAGRAPVTNMYESVVWVSLGIAFFALVFESVYRARLYLLTAGPLAAFSLILAEMLPAVLNPAIQPLPPVLRDNFWLVTHVLTITLGYSAFALAMGLAHVILARYLFAPGGMDERSLGHLYLKRLLEIGILLLAAGTLIGGFWAHYSWGRFWGWDPKETWALIALLLYIFALHGRLAGWWGNFGLAVASAVCFNGILMAWYGVNFVLGAGLHSYGFGGGGVRWVGFLVGLDLVFVFVCVFARVWRPRMEPPKTSRSLPPREAPPAEAKLDGLQPKNG